MAVKRVQVLWLVVLSACCAAGFMLYFSWDVMSGNFPMTIFGAATNTTTNLRPSGTDLTIMAAPPPARVDLNRIRVSGPLGLGEEEKWIDTRAPTRQESFAIINHMAVAGALDFRRVARYQLDDEYLTPSDRENLMDEPVHDLTRVASSDTSLLEFVGGPIPDKSGRVKVKVGDKVKVRLVLRDEVGRPVLKGGHDVRMWMVGQGPSKRAAAVDVTDLRNGTYVASLPILFGGNMEVRAALIRPREFRRIILVLLNTMKLINQQTASFVNGTTEQVTMCSFIPVIPGFPEVCNLTSHNGGLPWFCGRPTTPGLHCDHWAWSSHGGHPTHYPVSDTENALIARFAAKKDWLNKFRSILLLVARGGVKRSHVANKTCVPLKPRDTWADQSPRGFWEHEEWHPLSGCPLPPLNSSLVFRCLRNTHFIAFGDSNARQDGFSAHWQAIRATPHRLGLSQEGDARSMPENLRTILIRQRDPEVSEMIQSITKCRNVPDPQIQRHPNMLHVPIKFLCPKHNLQLSWYPHSYPFYTGIAKWSDTHVKHPLSYVLAKLPADRNYIIIIHLYLHFSLAHTYAYVHHVRDAANSIRKFLKRNLNTRVFIRGPHAVGGNNFRLPGDYHFERSLRILQREFQDLRDRVVLFNMWDMTVANENCAVHPDKTVVTTVCKLILSHVCPNTMI